MKYDAVVVGAGVSGMTAAALLAKWGMAVALVEKDAEPAPLIRGFRRHGITFDTGFHTAGGLGKGDAMDRLARYLGLTDHLNPVSFAGESFDRVRCLAPAGEFQFVAGRERLSAALTAAFPAEEAGVRLYMETVAGAGDSFPYMNPVRPQDASGGAGSMNGPTVSQFLDGITGDPLLKAVLSAHAFYYGVDPREAPVGLHAVAAGSYYNSAARLAGGGRELAEAFAKVLRRAGVAVLCGRGVEAVLAEGDAVAGIRLEGGEIISCRRCVLTPHPKIALALMPPGAYRPKQARRFAELEETVSGHVIHASLRRRVPFLEEANLLIVPDADHVCRPAGEAMAARPLYLAAARRDDGSVGGFSLIIMALPGETDAWLSSSRGRRPEGYHRFKSVLAEAAGEHLEKTCPELAGNFDIAAVATPLTYRDLAHSPKGSLYGVKHRVGQANPLPLTKVRHLVLAGQAVAAPGVLGAMISAFMAAEIFLGHDVVREDLRQCR